MAEKLVESERSLSNIEVLAMALAETGRFQEAVLLQEEGLSAVKQAGRTDLEGRLYQNLLLYADRQPTREPLSN